MTKEEIIAETTPHLSCPPDYLDVVTAELLRRLPDLAVKTCDDFGSHSGKCCESCHNFYPHYDMELIALPQGEWAWVCCAVRDAVQVSE
jgi:hypothetical protein